MTTSTTPLPNILDEARRLLRLAEEHSLPMRLIGGLAIRIRSDDGFHPGLSREYKDIDVVTTRRHGGDVADLLGSAGYTSAREFNALNSNRRLLFHDQHHDRKLDVFVGEFAMCHTIPMTERAMLEPITVPLAELILTKLQIVELNEKDIRDLIALFYHHDVAEHDGETINAAYIARLCASDWGLWRTTGMNLGRVSIALSNYDLAQKELEIVIKRLERLSERIDGEPKSSRWRLRDRIGDRKRWYEEPDDVE